jgi:4-methyl-5(b-hydroxyethyl)-thiazole monophosphate biosynthesis
MKKVLLLLSQGFEEIEAISVLDILRRSGVEIDCASYIPSGSSIRSEIVRGAHGIDIRADISFSDALQNEYDAIVLPGGAPNAQTLAESEDVLKLIRRYYDRGKLVAAICAAPKVLAQAGVSKGHTITSYPGFEHLFADYKTDAVVVSGNIVTSRGPGTAIPFALKLAEIIAGSAAAEKVKSDLCIAAGV